MLEVRPIFTKNIKLEINLDRRKNDHPRGPRRHSDVKNVFMEILQTIGIFFVHMGSLTKKLKRKIFNHRKITPQGGPMGRRSSKNFFVEILRSTYIFGAHIWSLSQKSQNYIKK